MSQAKVFLGRLARMLLKGGTRYAVISPGSRNAPLVLAFSAVPEINILTIPDERSAAYFALGLAQQTGKPTVLICTSGTAPLNYAPAVAEAYYQKIPLLVFTADRPEKQIDQGDGQTIRQNGIYNNFIRGAFVYPEDFDQKDDAGKAEQMISEAFKLCQYPEPGPVHINFPFTEPLYGFRPDLESEVRLLNNLKNDDIQKHDPPVGLIRAWRLSEKKMIVTGQMPPGNGLTGKLMELAHDPSVVVLTETTSNLAQTGQFVTGIDNVVETFGEDEKKEFLPDLVLTLGGHIISRKIKSFLSSADDLQHWHINLLGQGMDMFGHLAGVARGMPGKVLEHLPAGSEGSGFRDLWLNRSQRSMAARDAFVREAPWSDIKALGSVFAALPSGSVLHLGNSTPVRYHQLFAGMTTDIEVFGNRGVSGIDGTVSTAAGAAWASGKPVYLVTGDMGFFYDSNGLWHQYHSKKLRIIVVNNGGGGIFRYIPGPQESGRLRLFEAPHQRSARSLADFHGIDYLKAHDEQSLADALNQMHDHPKACLLEIFTPRETNGLVLKEYFSSLKKTIP